MTFTIPGVIVWVIAAAILVNLVRGGWEEQFGEEAGLLAAYTFAVIGGIFVSQIFFVIPFLNWGGLDWASTLSLLFVGEWYLQLAGSLTLFILAFGFAIFPFWLFTRLFKISTDHDTLRGVIYIWILMALPTLLGWYFSFTAIPDPFKVGLGSFITYFWNLVAGWPLVFILLISDLIFIARRTLDEGQTDYVVQALPGGLALGWVGLLLTGDWFMAALSAFYAVAWVGMRWPTLVDGDRRLPHTAYWFLRDLPALVIWIGSWLLWHIGWLSFALGVVAFLFAIGAMPLVLVGLFPVISREDRISLFRAGNQKEEADRLERELRTYNTDALRQKTLKQLGKQKSQVAHAEQLRAAGQTAEARQLVDGVVAALERVSPLIPEQKALLGEAQLVQGRLAMDRGSFSDAHALLEKARKNGMNADAESVGRMAEYLAGAGKKSEADLRTMLDYLKSQRGSPATDRFRKVSKFLYDQCALTAKLSDDKLAARLELARKVVEANPAIAWAHRIIGEVSMRLEKWSEALLPLETARQLDSTDPVTYACLGQVYHNTNRLPEARRAFEESLKLNPQQPGVIHDLGVLILDDFPASSEENRAAIRWLDAAAKAEPKNAAWWFDLARAQVRAGENKEARQTAEKALKLDAHLLPARKLLANILYKEGNWTEVIPHLREITKFDPENVTFQFYLGHALTETRAFAEAIPLLDPLAASMPEALLCLGRACLGNGQAKAAVSHLQLYLQHHPRTSQPLYTLGCALAWLGAEEHPRHWLEAAAIFEEIQKSRDAYYPRVTLQLGHLHLRQQNLDKAAAAYQEASHYKATLREAILGLARIAAFRDDTNGLRVMSSLEPADERSQSVQAVRGLIYELQGQWELAENAYRQAQDSGALGVILQRQKKVAEAAEMFAKARASGDTSDRVLYYSGLSRASAHDYEGAIAEWDLLAHRYPDDPRLLLNLRRLWYLHGCSCYQRQDYFSAAKAWEHFFEAYQSDEETRRSLQNVYLLAVVQNIQQPLAAQALRRARQLGASDETCRSLECIHEWKTGQTDPAAFEKLAASDPSPQNLFNLGLALLNLHQDPKAADLFNRVLKGAAPELKHRAAWGLAICHARSGEWQTACDLMETLN
ncbi:MAG TPA: tetratricopeptide repeat protein [Anaerolineaceae bacterium]|nr:tetratricopeptide repeat protein [Anaerolineaceae bacterium]HPN50636.1 tetratricopeptide repeat protein [Anaerolineaceae bacterium]